MSRQPGSDDRATAPQQSPSAAGDTGQQLFGAAWGRLLRARSRRWGLKWPQLFGGGVASRILTASSLMLFGIVLLASAVGYYVLSNAHRDKYEDLVRSSAEAVARNGQLANLTHVQLENQIDANRRSFELDMLVTTPVSRLQNDELSGASSSGEDMSAAPDEADADARRAPGLREPAGVGIYDLPDLSSDEISALERGQGLMVFKGHGADGMLYFIEPIMPTPAGFEKAVVISGVSELTVRSTFRVQAATIVGIGLGIILMGSASVWLTSRGLRQATGDYGSEELRNLIGYYRSVLRSVSEGLLLLDEEHGIVLYNAAAAELLNMPESAGDEPFTVRDLDVPVELIELISSGRYVRDEIHYTDSRILVVNQQPALGSGERSTWVTTMRDHTELRKLTGELISVRSFSDSLRSQTHEFANRMHIIASLIEMGKDDKALEFATQGMSMMDRPAADDVGGFAQPALSALIFTKIAQARESDIDLTVDTSGLRDTLPGDERDLITVLGNLLDNAFDALSRPGVDTARRRVRLTVSGSDEDGHTITVGDDGPGIPDECVDMVFEHGWSTKHDGMEADTGAGELRTASPRGVGMSIVVQAVRRLGGAIDADGGLGDEAAPGELRGAEFTVWLPPNVVTLEKEPEQNGNS